MTVSDFSERRRRKLQRERASRLLWGQQCAEQILGMFVDMRVDLAWLGRFVSRLARRGGPTARDTAVLARAMAAARYGPPPAPRDDDNPIQLELDLEAGASRVVGLHVAGGRIAHNDPEGAA